MSTIDNTATENSDVYQRVTDAIIQAIQQGVGNWRMPWHTSGKFAFSPIKVTSKKPYRGINTVCLWAAAESKGYERAEWATYQQWQDKGAQVRKGERATTVVFWKFANGETQDEGDATPASGSRLLFTRGYSVFNAAQVDGYTPKADTDLPVLERIAQAETFFNSMVPTRGSPMPKPPSPVWLRKTCGISRQLRSPAPPPSSRPLRSLLSGDLFTPFLFSHSVMMFRSFCFQKIRRETRQTWKCFNCAPSGLSETRTLVLNGVVGS